MRFLSIHQSLHVVLTLHSTYFYDIIISILFLLFRLKKEYADGSMLLKVIEKKISSSMHIYTHTHTSHTLQRRMQSVVALQKASLDNTVQSTVYFRICFFVVRHLFLVVLFVVTILLLHIFLLKRKDGTTVEYTNTHNKNTMSSFTYIYWVLVLYHP